METDKCKSCGKSVYATEKVNVPGLDKQFSVYHKNCLECSVCNVKLNVSNYGSANGVLYCQVHLKQFGKPEQVKGDNSYFVSPLASNDPSYKSGPQGSEETRYDEDRNNKGEQEEEEEKEEEKEEERQQQIHQEEGDSYERRSSPALDSRNEKLRDSDSNSGRNSPSIERNNSGRSSPAIEQKRNTTTVVLDEEDDSKRRESERQRKREERQRQLEEEERKEEEERERRRKERERRLESSNEVSTTTDSSTSGKSDRETEREEKKKKERRR